MVRRIGLLTIAIALSVSMGCPAVAQAAKAWRVTWTNGLYAATIVAEAQTHWDLTQTGPDCGPGATVWSRTIHFVEFDGEITHDMTENGPVADNWVVFSGHGQDESDLVVERVNENHYKAVRLAEWSAPNTTIVSATRRKTGPWHAKVRLSGHFKMCGTVPHSCPGAYAAGVWLLIYPPSSLG